MVQFPADDGLADGQARVVVAVMDIIIWTISTYCTFAVVAVMARILTSSLSIADPAPHGAASLTGLSYCTTGRSRHFVLNFPRRGKTVAGCP